MKSINRPYILPEFRALCAIAGWVGAWKQTPQISSRLFGTRYGIKMGEHKAKIPNTEVHELRDSAAQWIYRLSNIYVQLLYLVSPLPAFQPISHVSLKRHWTHIYLQNAINEIFIRGKLWLKKHTIVVLTRRDIWQRLWVSQRMWRRYWMNKSIGRLIFIYYDTWELPWTGAQRFGYEQKEPTHTTWFYTQPQNTSRVSSLTYASIHQLPRLFQVDISVTLTPVSYWETCWYFALNLVSR